MRSHGEVRININVGNFYSPHDLLCKTRSRPPFKTTTHTVWSLNKFFGQPDDGLHTGPKHVVVYYISLLAY